jgi:DNA topoisomerase-3
LEQLAKNEELNKMTGVAQTTEWEQKLADNPEAFETEIAAFVRACVNNASPQTVFQKDPLGLCPLCGKPVVETKLGYGCSGFRDNPQCRFVIWKTVAGAAVSLTDAKLLLSGQKTQVKKCKKKDGKTFEAAFVLEGGKLTFTFT